LLLALDPAYTSTTGAQDAVTYLAPIYQAAFSNFLEVERAAPGQQ